MLCLVIEAKPELVAESCKLCSLLILIVTHKFLNIKGIERTFFSYHYLLFSYSKYSPDTFDHLFNLLKQIYNELNNVCVFLSSLNKIVVTVFSFNSNHDILFSGLQEEEKNRERSHKSTLHNKELNCFKFALSYNRLFA